LLGKIRHWLPPNASGIDDDLVWGETRLSVLENCMVHQHHDDVRPIQSVLFIHYQSTTLFQRRGQFLDIRFDYHTSPGMHFHDISRDLEGRTLSQIVNIWFECQAET